MPFSIISHNINLFSKAYPYHSLTYTLCLSNINIPHKSTKVVVFEDTVFRVGRPLSGNTVAGGGGNDSGSGGSGGKLYSGWVGPTPLSLSCRGGASQIKGFHPLLEKNFLASTGFLEHLKTPTYGALSTQCLPSPSH